MRKATPKYGFPWWKYLIFITVIAVAFGGIVYYFFIGPQQRRQNLQSRFGNRVWHGSYSIHYVDMSPGIGVDVLTYVQVSNLRLDFASPEMDKYIQGIISNAVPLIGDGVFTSGPRLMGGVRGTVSNAPISFKIDGLLDLADQEIHLGLGPEDNHEVITHMVIPGKPPIEWDVNDALSEFVMTWNAPVKITGDWQAISINQSSLNKTITGSLTSSP